jgi:cytochrome c oxidase subunit 2
MYQGEGVAFYSTLARASSEARHRGSGIDPANVENYLLDVDRPLVVPKGAKVRVLLTSNDVIHAWWVPELSIKKDAIPGFMNETWFQADVAGVYRGQCAELCGVDHAYMPIVVEVVELEAFQAFLDSEREPEPAAASGSNTSADSPGEDTK